MNDIIEGCRVTGSILLDGEDIYAADMDVVHLRARVGMVFQKPNPFPKSIFENVAYGPRIHGLAKDKHELEQIVHESLQRAGLLKEVQDRLQQPGTGLSGGQQQRLCIARAIAVQPEVILMDEPCSALDPIATARIEELIDELRQNYTIVIVTHSMQQAARVSQRTGFFHLGILVETAPPKRSSPIPATSARRTTSPAGSARPRNAIMEMTGMNSEHIVRSFDDQLRRLENLIAEMGGLAEAQLADAIDAMSKRDLEKAARITADDQRIDDLEMLVDQEAIAMLALRQPMAKDLREIVGALRAASMLERIGDYAKNVAKRTAALVETPAVPSAQTVVRLGMLAQEMIKDVLDAYIARDAEKADLVRQRDKELDALHTSIFRELLTYMMEDPRNITACTHLLFIAKNIERIGDHATNIAEVVIFVVQGRTPGDQRPKEDVTSFTVL